MKSVVLEITTISLILWIIAKEELSYQTIFWMEVIRTYSLMEALARSPDIWIIQRVLFDLVRMFIIPWLKMLAISNFNLNELMSSLPKVWLIIAVLYNIPKESISKYYTKNRYVRTILHMEFRYFKSINYIKFIAVLRKLHPSSMIFNFLMADLIEGCSVVFIHCVEMFYNTGTPDFRNFWINFKGYLILNVISILYFSDVLCVSQGSWLYGFISTEFLYQILWWTILFLTAWYQLQNAFSEETIFEMTANAINPWMIKIFNNFCSPSLKMIRGTKNYIKKFQQTPAKSEEAKL